MKVLITGGLGFIGHHVVAQLRASEIRATAVDNESSNGYRTPEIDAEYARRKQRLETFQGLGEILHADVLDPLQVRDVLRQQRPTHVIHLAGLSRVDLARRNPAAAWHSNLDGTRILLEQIAHTGGVRRVILASSSTVYGHTEDAITSEAHPCRPIEPYGASKLASEILLQAWSREHGIPSTILRPSAVYGIGDFNQRVLPTLLASAMAGQPLLLHDGGQVTLDFTYVEDVAQAFVLASQSPAADGEIFNITAGRSRTLLEAAHILKTFFPDLTTRLSASDGQRPRRGDFDISKARRLLGYSPSTSLETGLTRMISAFGIPVSDSARSLSARLPNVRLSPPSIGEKEIDAVSRTLRSGWLTHGPENQQFEEEFATYIQVSHALSLSSCAGALLVALRAAQIDGEVIVPAFTFCAVPNSVVLAGARPIFVDVEDATLGLDPQAVRAAITPRTTAILAVHAAGAPCRIRELRKIADEKNLLLIEDVAQAAGARVGNDRLGSFGHLSCFSFFPTKNMTTAEGGMLVSNDAALMARARSLSAHGLLRGTSQRQYDVKPWERRLLDVGHNFRLAAPLAALGRVQLARLDEMNAARATLARRLTAALNGSGLRLPANEPGSDHVYQLYSPRTPDGYPRDAFVLALRHNGIESTVHYDSILPSEAPFTSMSDWRPGMWPVAERIARTIFSLPMHPSLTFGDIDHIASVVRDTLPKLSAVERPAS